MKRASALLLGLLALAACGNAPKPAAPVRLSVDAPADMALLRQDTVEVHGIVTPGTAEVLVDGERVPVQDGRWTTTVGLLPGTNLIDVMAGRERARPAIVALRVRRQVTVKVPDLVGFTPKDAKEALAGLGLKPDVHEASGFLEFILPEDASVCETAPPAGTSVDSGSTVQVLAAKRC